MISEVAKIEEEGYKIKAVSQQYQGRWTTWEAVVNRTISWADMWRMPQARLSFTIRATYDTLPSPQNLRLWYGTEKACHLWGSSNPGLQHILLGCKVALTQGRFRWHRDRVLRKLADILEARRLKANNASLLASHQRIQFVKQEAKNHGSNTEQLSLLFPGGEWNMSVDLDRQLRFPQVITTTIHHADIVLWSVPMRSVIMVELTVPWEEGIDAAFERKKERYSDLAAECRQAGWKATADAEVLQVPPPCG